MTPRTRMVALPSSADEAQTLAIVCEDRHSRYPVYEQDRDHVIGVLHVKDLAAPTIQPIGSIRVAKPIKASHLCARITGPR